MDNIITNHRTLHSDCTTGEWFHNGERICYSIERPWLSNTPYISCVPPGDYIIKPISTNRHPDSFFLENKNLGVSWDSNTVRTLIEVHIANKVSQLAGCLGPGMGLYQKIGKVPTVGRSADAMEMLNALVESFPGEWILRIIQ